MTSSNYTEIKRMTRRLIAFINWEGATFESKKKKIIKEISLIREFCKTCVDE